MYDPILCRFGLYTQVHGGFNYNLIVLGSDRHNVIVLWVHILRAIKAFKSHVVPE